MKRLFFLFVVGGFGVLGWLAFSLKMPAGPFTRQPEPFLVKPGTPARAVARDLESQGFIRSGNAFLIWHVLNGRRPIKAGEYEIAARMDATFIHDILVSGRELFHEVLVPEGSNQFDVAGILDDAGLCPRKDFLKAARDNAALAHEWDPQATSLEGYLFPDTYHFSRTQSCKDLATAMAHRFRREANSLGLLDGGQDVRKTVTLASIVEKETGVATERARIAGVFTNRLRQNMVLATDPTVVYASLLAGKYDGVIRQSDLALDSPYNTYKHAGLPPGPISNPGRAALEAAMHPEKNDYLFFVADNNGGHNFAKTAAEHSRNVAKYRRGETPKKH